jgi:hypothetical protein
VIFHSQAHKRRCILSAVDSQEFNFDGWGSLQTRDVPFNEWSEFCKDRRVLGCVVKRGFYRATFRERIGVQNISENSPCAPAQVS